MTEANDKLWKGLMFRAAALPVLPSAVFPASGIMSRYILLSCKNAAVSQKERQIMASSKEYLEFVLEQLSELDDITYRAMMGEYIIYYKGKVAGGIYDDRFLVKPVQAARKLMPSARLEKPYEGAKDMLLADELEDRDFLKKLFEAMYEELPAPKKKKKQG